MTISNELQTCPRSREIAAHHRAKCPPIILRNHRPPSRETRTVAHDSGTLRGKRAIAGGRRALRHVMFQAALVAAHHNPSLRPFADRLRNAGKPHKVIITAVARKLVTIANALCKSRQNWTVTTI